MAASSSSSSGSMVEANSPYVYFTYHGVDMRNNFIDHLAKAFFEGGIKCYINNDLGPIIGLENVFKRMIDNAKIALPIFSEDYSQSKWCLDELVKIMEDVVNNKLKVIPIFFKVKVEDVRFFRGEFGQNLYGHHDRSNMRKWEFALNFIAAQKGLNSADYRTKEDLIVYIIMAIKSMLSQISPIRVVEEGNNMLSTVSSSSNILSGTIDQPRMDIPIYVIEKLFKQLEEKLDIKRAEGRTVDSNISTSYLPHQVFINFRGELRYNFISHLVDALRRKSINVFIDTQENRGEDISHLLTRIEDSRIAIVVFSSKYTESKWCLREAETIMERANQGKLIVFPIFYKVTPMNVKHLKGEFGDNFRDREREYRNDESVIKKWKKALTYIAGKIGIVVNDQSDENDSIASIVNEVIRMLTSIPLDTQTA